MRLVLAGVLIIASGTCAAEWKQPTVVDLNQPGALDRVAAENPAHYRQILDVARTMQEKSCAEALRAYRARFDGGLTCSSYVTLTSLPPKRHLSLTLDGVRYMKWVPVEVGAELRKVR